MLRPQHVVGAAFSLLLGLAGQADARPARRAEAPLLAGPEQKTANLCHGPSLANAGIAAAETLRCYYRALKARDFATAYKQWADDGSASGKSFAEFSKGFADTVSTAVMLGTPGPPEGAAGSTFITIPVTVNATLKNGTRQRFTGTYSLRRVNDVPGATADQLSWRIRSAQLHAAH